MCRYAHCAAEPLKLFQWIAAASRAHGHGPRMLLPACALKFFWPRNLGTGAPAGRDHAAESFRYYHTQHGDPRHRKPTAPIEQALVIVNSNGCQARRLATDTEHTSQGWPPSISALYYIDGEISGLQLVRQGNIQCRRPKRSTVWVQGD